VRCVSCVCPPKKWPLCTQNSNFPDEPCLNEQESSLKILELSIYCDDAGETDQTNSHPREES